MEMPQHVPTTTISTIDSSVSRTRKKAMTWSRIVWELACQGPEELWREQMQCKIRCNSVIKPEIQGFNSIPLCIIQDANHYSRTFPFQSITRQTLFVGWEIADRMDVDRILVNSLVKFVVVCSSTTCQFPGEASSQGQVDQKYNGICLPLQRSRHVISEPLLSQMMCK